MAREPRKHSGGNGECGHRCGAEGGSVNDGGQSGRLGRTIQPQRHPPASPEFTADDAEYTDGGRGKEFRQFFSAGSACSAVRTAPGGTLFGRLLPRISRISRMADEAFGAREFASGWLAGASAERCKRMRGEWQRVPEEPTGENRGNRVKGMIVKGIKIRNGGHRFGAEHGSVNDGGQSGRLGRAIQPHRHPPASPEFTADDTEYTDGYGGRFPPILFRPDRRVRRFALLLAARFSGDYYHGFHGLHGWQTRHLGRGSLQAADWQGLPLNGAREGGGNGRGTRRTNRRKQRKQRKKKAGKMARE